jgi:hypothetical protein
MEILEPCFTPEHSRERAQEVTMRPTSLWLDSGRGCGQAMIRLVPCHHQSTAPDLSARLASGVAPVQPNLRIGLEHVWPSNAIAIHWSVTQTPGAGAPLQRLLKGLPAPTCE